MNKLNSLVCLLAVASLSVGVTAQENEVDPSGMISPLGGGSARGLGALVAGPYDVESAPYDNRCLGVEEAWGHLWVTGRGHTSVGDNYMIHQYDMNGVYITSYPQNVSSSNLAGWGGRDMEADEVNNMLYVGNDNGYVEVMSYDATTGALTYSNTVWSNVSGTVRALCQDPGSGNYFTKSFTGDISEFDMATGTVINTFSNTMVSAYGFGWDSSMGTIWSSDTGAGGTELDPATGMSTGRSFIGSGGAQGGVDVYFDARGNAGAGGMVMATLTQEAPDSIYVYDTVGTPPPAWANLPTAFVPAGGYTENFDSLGGVVPGHMATNHGLQGTNDPEAWCNVGQQGASGLAAFSGTQSLEMGLDPISTNYHDVWNALIVGLNGGGSTALTLDMQIIDHGEESHIWDGIWVSDNGTDWHFTGQDWNPLGSAWQAVTGIDLSNAGADCTGDFYLMFAQNDNFPCGYLDGVQIDDLVINGGGPSGPSLAVNNLVSGATAVVDCNNCTPGGVVYFVWSAAGGGPIGTPFGTGYVSPPYSVIPLMADMVGDAQLQQPVPPGLTGMNLWFHGADVGSATMLNALAMTIG